MKKRVVALLLGMAMAVSAMAGCGNTVTVKESESSTAESTGTVETTVGSTEEETEKPYWEMLNDVSDTSELPDWEGDTLEINFWFAASTTAGVDPFSAYPETDVAWKEFERVTGVKVNWDECFDNNGQNIAAKLPMVVASKDLPTVVMGYGIDSQMRTLYDEGYLADLTEYYENGDLDQVTYWLPTEEMSFVYDQMRTEDGAIYGIPYGETGNGTRMANLYEKTGYSVEEYDAEYFNIYGKNTTSQAGRTSAQTIWIRDDILTALYPEAMTMDEIREVYMENGTFTEEQIFDLGIDSFEEFQDLLRDIKELIDGGGYVGLDGKPMEVMYGPHTETDNWYLGAFLPYFVTGAGSSTDYFSYVDLTEKDPEQVVKRTIDSEWFVEYIKGMNEMVREGILAKDSLLDNKTMWAEKVNNHHYAVHYVQNSNGDKYAGDGYKYRPVWFDIPVREDVSGISTVTLNTYYGIFKDTLSDEEMDQLIHAINYMNSVVGTNNFFWGPESAGLFTTDADGHRTYKDEALYNSVIHKEDNGEFRKYGLCASGTASAPNNVFFRSLGSTFLNPQYLEKQYLEKGEGSAYLIYNPGILPGRTETDNTLYVTQASTIHGAFGQTNEDIKTFWSARPGFEDQLKKVLASESEAEFEANLDKLRVYADENGLTAETMKTFSADWVEANKADLALAGYSY
ncbi:MAG: extracellular solute-binding protein [Lachnospiraceae bacterium]|nr:extracellular solute-binding protein [Lachnospiraceae bacterium]